MIANVAKKRTPSEKKNNPWPSILKGVRSRHGLTQVEAAAKLGIPTRTWIAWENHQSVPSKPSQQLLKAKFPKDF